MYALEPAFSLSSNSYFLSSFVLLKIVYIPERAKYCLCDPLGGWRSLEYIFFVRLLESTQQTTMKSFSSLLSSHQEQQQQQQPDSLSDTKKASNNNNINHKHNHNNKQHFRHYRISSDGTTPLQHHFRNSSSSHRSSSSYSQDPTILSVLGEDEQESLVLSDATTAAASTAASSLATSLNARGSVDNTTNTTNSAAMPSFSPGTPPKKLWERQYGSFLKRNRGMMTSIPATTMPKLPHAATAAIATNNNITILGDTRGGTTTTTSSTAIGDSLPMAGHPEVWKNNNNNNNNHQQVSPPSPSKGGGDGSVRGGNFFANVLFRSTDSLTKLTRKTSADSSSTTHTAKHINNNNSKDELDGTMRRGSSPRSPRNVRSVKCVVPIGNGGTSSSISSSNICSSMVNPSAATTLENNINDSSRRVVVPQSPGTIYLKPRMATTASGTVAVDSGGWIHGGYEDGEPCPPPFLIPPRTGQQQSGVLSFENVRQQQQQAEVLPSVPLVPIYGSQSSPSASDKTRKQLEHDAAAVVSANNNNPKNGPSNLSDLKKAFTDFHNSSVDANSAFLGDDPSMSGRALCFTHKNEHLMEVGVANMMKPSKSHGHDLFNSDDRRRRSVSVSQLGQKEKISINPSNRILKQIVGVESWQTGRRYLIAPAVLAASPGDAISFMFGNSFQTLPQSIEQHGDVVLADTSPFGMVVLGECLLTFVTNPSFFSTVQQWSSAQLVLRQNYLLEYDVEADVRTSVPRGYAHLQFATTVLHDHFKDSLELHFFGSPCAKDDARVLMIRIVPSLSRGVIGNVNLDDSVNSWPKIREAWRTCLNRAATLTVKDLFDYDELNILGNGQYAEVRAARRRTQHVSNATTMKEVKALENGSHSYNCALKIFDKQAFWRLVVKGRERADTIVRETSVQATLVARCSQNSSVLRIRGFFETSEKVVLELELLDGIDLFKYIISMNTIPESEAALIMRDVLGCLDVMAKNGLAHRDVKPANILMCIDHDKVQSGETAAERNVASPRVKIGDFGMAAFVGVDKQVRGRCGTPGYVAPEIFTAGVYGGYGNKVDVFSAGVTLYVMLCGYEPFYGETDEELKEANKASKFDFPIEEWGSVSAEAIDLVKKMMESDPAKRLDARHALQHPWFSHHHAERQTELQKLSVNSCRDDACVVT